VLVGGLGSWLGPVAGVLFFLALTEGLRFLGEYRMMIYGIVVVVAMNVRPHGLIDANVVHRLKDLLKIRARGPREEA